MQLKDLKNRTNESIKKISFVLHKKNRKNIFYIFITAFGLIFIALLIILFFNLSPIIFKLIETNKNTKKDNNAGIILKLAEEEYNKGYLENSALKYQKIVNLDISRVNKILAYKRLFEISILRKNYNDAIMYLNKIEKIDKKVFEIYINKIKIYLRQKDYVNAEKEIDKNRKRLRRSTEYKELTGIFYMLTGNHKEALKAFESIPYSKREYNVHKKLIFCFMKFNKLKECIKYIEKIEKKINYLGSNSTKSELIAIKQVVNIKLIFQKQKNNNNYTELVKQIQVNNIIPELKRAAALSEYNRAFILRLILYMEFFIDESEDLSDVLYQMEDILTQDTALIKMIGDYFIYKRNYEQALVYYKRLEDIKELSIDELMVLINLNFYLSQYNKSIYYMEMLNQKYDYFSPELYKNLSAAYSRTGEVNNQIFYLKEGLMEYPDDINFYVLLANTYLKISENEKALSYIEEAKNLYRNNSGKVYDKRLDKLYLLALKNEESKITEGELLNLRENDDRNPEYYIGIIKYYLKNKMYTDAKREIDTLSRLPMDDLQKKIFNICKMIYYLNIYDYESFSSVKEEYFQLINIDTNDKINIAIINIFDNNYNQALKTLESINLVSIDEQLKNKILYLKALCFFYKDNFTLSYKILDILPINYQTEGRVVYLKDLIRRKFGETE